MSSIIAAGATPTPTVAAILSRPRGGWYWTKSHWTGRDLAELRVLATAGADLSKSADALGRSPGAVERQARALGINLSPAWRISHHTKPRAPREPVVTL